MSIRLAKYEALGNDFLVLLDLDGTGALGPAAVRALCDRRHGVGADGVLRVLPALRVRPAAPVLPALRVPLPAPERAVPPTPERPGAEGAGGGRGAGGGSSTEGAGEPGAVGGPCDGGEPGAEGADLVMELTNADGGPAETSGNGLRCAVAGAIDAGLVPGAGRGGVVRVLTGAGLAEVELVELGPGGRFQMSAEMGKVSVLEEPEPPLPGWRAFAVDVGNPHLVLLAADAETPGAGASAVDLAVLGPELERSRPGGVNVELVTLDHGTDRRRDTGSRRGADRREGAGRRMDTGRQRGTGCRMEVWERGAGLTLACGSGSCAAAAVVRAVGLAGDVVEVANPGGTLTVRLDGPLSSARARLEGPARRVAHVEVDLDALLAPEGSSLGGGAGA